METVDDGNYTCCFTYTLIKYINDFDCLRFFVNIVAKKLQETYIFTRIKEDMGDLANAQLLHNAFYQEFQARASALLAAHSSTEKDPKGPRLRTTLEIVLHHGTDLPRRDVELWTSFFRKHYTSVSHVKKIEATIVNNAVLKLDLIKGCGCLLSSVEAPSPESPLLFTEELAGAKSVKVGDKKNFPPKVKMEMLIMGVCGTCFEEGLNEACNLFLETRDTKFQLVANITLHSRTNHT